MAGTYCTQADVSIAAGGNDRLRELTDQQGNGAIDATVLAGAIDAACSWIDMYLQRRLAVPLASPPAIIKRLAAAEAVYLLRQARRMPLEDHHAVAHEERHQLLVDIASGRAGLDVDPLPAKSTNVEPAVIPRDTATFPVSRDNLKGFW